MSSEQSGVPRKRILVIFFLLGAAAVTYQSVLLREFMVLAFGNELAWGLLLFAWLTGVGLGATVAGRFRLLDRRRVLGAFVGLVTALALVAWTGPVAARLVRFVFDLTPGQTIPLLHMVWLAGVVAGPTALLVGLCFPLACVLVADHATGETGTTAVYVAESLGSLAGGACFSFVLVSLLPGLGAVALLSTCLVAAVMTLWFQPPRCRPVVGLSLASLVLAVLAVSWLVGVDRKLDEKLVHLRWQAMQGADDLLSSTDSRYQNIVLTALAEQYSVYLDGMIATTFPDPITFAEAAHLVACEHPAPKSILIVGGGMEGLVSQLLLHPVEQIDCVSLDAMMLEVMRPHLAPTDEAALNDPRVTVHHGDGRLFVKRAQTRYDLVIVNSPGPASAMLNRTYTREFFGEVGRILTPSGVLTFELASTESYFTKDRKRYLASVHRALTETFEDVLMTWGSSSRVFACRAPGVLTLDPKVLRQRYEKRGVASPHFYPEWFDHAAREMLAREKVEQLRAAAESAVETPANSDWFPNAYFTHLVIWDELTGGRSRAVLSLLSSVQQHWPWVMGMSVLASALWLGWCRLRTRGDSWFGQAVVVWSTATTGFAAMSIELVLLFAFQSLYGYVYQRIGLIVALFMFGLAAGALTANRWLRGHAVGPRHLATLDLAILVMLAATPGLLLLAGQLSALSPAWTEALVLLEVALAGGLAGGAFPLSIGLYRATGAGTGRTAGSVDAADHIGACLGALLAGVALIPVMGMTTTCLLLAFLKLTSVALLAGWGLKRRA